MMSTRPVSACAGAGIAAYRVDPARTYRPGRRSRLSCALMASSSSGTCWYSSISTGSADSTNRPGSARTADRVAGSSQSITGRPRRPANWPRSVLLPTVRGPVKTSRMFPCDLYFPGFRAISSRFPRVRFPFSASQLPQIHERRDQEQRPAEAGKPSAEDVAVKPLAEESAGAFWLFRMEPVSGFEPPPRRGAAFTERLRRTARI
jgi:hypothetical protein